MLSLPKLITTEEVYDLDVFELKDVLNVINNTQTDDPQWNKKAFKLKDLITLELQERDAIENFAFKIDYTSIVQQNDTLKAILDDIKNRPPNYLDQFGAIKEQQKIEQKVEQKREPMSRQNELSNSTVSHVTNITNNLKIQKKKKDGLLDFMKDVLKKTDVGDQKFFIGQATQGRYVPPAPKPKQTTVEKVKADHIKQKKKRKEKLEKLEQRSSSVINQKSRASQQSVDTKSSKQSTQVSSASKPKEDTQQMQVIDNQKNKDKIDNIQIVQTSVNQQNNQDNQVELVQLKQNQTTQQSNQQIQQEIINDKPQIINQNQRVENLSQNVKLISSEYIQQNASFQKLKKSIIFDDDTNDKQQNKPQLPQQQVLQNNSQLYRDQSSNQSDIEVKQNNEKITTYQELTYSQTNPVSYNHQVDHANEYKKQDLNIQSNQNQSNSSHLSKHDQKEQPSFNDIIQIEETKQAISQINDHQHREKDNFVIKTIKEHPLNQLKQQQSPKQKDLKPIQYHTQLPTQRQEIDEEIAEDYNEQEDESDQEPVKIKLQKQLVGKVVQVAQKKQVIEIKYENKQQQKEEKKDKNKLDDIKKLCDDMDLKDFMPKDKEIKVEPPQTSKPSSQQAKKPRVPLAPQPSIKQNVQSKFITKMMTMIDDSKLVDYSDIIPTFQSLFSGFYLSQPNYNHLDAMREIHSIFNAHIDKVDNVDQLLNKYKLNIFNPNELQYINDPKKLVVYASKTNIDIQQFIQRQMMFNQRLQNEDQKSDQYFRVIKTKEEVYDIITRSFMRKIGWSELPHGAGLKTSWNVLWTWSKPQIDLNKLILFQKVNHFSFNKNLARKDLLKKNIERCQKLGQKTAAMFDIIPTTFLLPKEYVQFVERFYKDQETEGQHNIWIMKPTSKSRGRGITVINDVSEVMYAEPVVLQKYLKNPLLIKGHKFDMRIYVLVTQFNPLEAFLYKEGFARLTTEPFTLDINDLKNTLIHLTNFAVQKHNVHQPQDFEQQFGGSKLSLRQLKEKLQDKLDWNNIWDQVQDIIVKSLCATQSEIPHNPNSFELFGYDIIIDTNHKCWLLEVNSSPSLARDYVLDELVKQQLIDDIFDLIQPIHFDRQRLCEVLERRILEEQGCKSAINTLNNSKLQVSRDVNYILRGQKIRKYGEMPQNMGGFQRIAPSDRYERYKNLLSNYKTVNGRGTID